MVGGERFHKLEAAGIASSTLPEEVRQALDGLSEAEVDALIAAKQKVLAATREVEGFFSPSFKKIEYGVQGETASPRPETLNPDQFAHEGGFVF